MSNPITRVSTFKCYLLQNWVPVFHRCASVSQFLPASHPPQNSPSLDGIRIFPRCLLSHTTDTFSLIISMRTNPTELVISMLHNFDLDCTTGCANFSNCPLILKPPNHFIYLLRFFFLSKSSFMLSNHRHRLNKPVVTCPI